MLVQDGWPPLLEDHVDVREEDQAVWRVRGELFPEPHNLCEGGEARLRRSMVLHPVATPGRSHSPHADGSIMS